MKSAYKKYFTTAALVWAGCFAFFFFVYMLVLAPQQNSRKQIAKQLVEKKQVRDSAIKAAQEETRVKLNEQLGYLRNKAKEFVINFEDSANLTFDIRQIAEEKGITSFSIKTQDSRSGSPLPNCKYICENHIDISFNAEFNQFAAFLNALERHRPVVFIDRFSITRADQENSGHQVKMDLVVFVRTQQDS
jgi:Tfp pilus assembly protein PilO